MRTRTKNRTRVLTREQVISRLQKSYPEMNCMLTEDFNGLKGGIWLSAEDGIEDRKGNLLFNYWTENYTTYNFGVVAHLERWANRNGWFFEWHDAGTIMIWLI